MKSPVQHQFLFVQNRRDIHFVKLFNWILQLEISSDAKVILAKIMDHAQGSDVVELSYPTLSRFTHLHPSRVRRSIQELQELGLLHRQNSIAPNGADAANQYLISNVIFKEIVYWSQPDSHSFTGLSSAAGGLSSRTPTRCHPRQGDMSPVTHPPVIPGTHGVPPVTPTGCQGRHPLKKKTNKKTGNQRPKRSASERVVRFVEELRNHRGYFSSDLEKRFAARCIAQFDSSDWKWLENTLLPDEFGYVRELNVFGSQVFTSKNPQGKGIPC